MAQQVGCEGALGTVGEFYSAESRPPAGYKLLLEGSFFLAVNLAVTAATGLVFWLLAARLFDRPSVGLASSLYASVAFVNYATGLGVPTAIVRYAREGESRWVALYTWGLVFSALSSVVGSLIFLAVVDFPGGQSLLGSGLSGAAVLAVLTAGVALSFLIDLRLIAARRYRLLLAKNGLIGVARVVLLLVPLSASASTCIFLASVVPQAAVAAVILVSWCMLSKGVLSLRPIPNELGGVLRFSGVNYIASLALGAPTYALPVIVLTHVSADAYATFYVAWTIASVPFLVPAAIGQALLVEGSQGRGSLGRQTSLGLGLSVALMAIAVAVATFAPGVVSVAFGANYSVSGPVLAGLMLAGIPWAITSTAVSVARVFREHVATLLMTVSLGSTVVVTGLVLTAANGVDGAVSSWLIGHLTAAGVATVYLLILATRWRSATYLGLR